MPISHLPPPMTAAVPGPPPPPPAVGQPAPAAGSPGGGPPPPPTGPSGEGEQRARTTAATWVAATGALLLLAAAGTFLAVAWETMGLPARVAVVGALTGAAILGGHRLRSLLPAVGSVVFHLGALLVPVDVFGLTLQLDVATPGRWLATGGSAMVAFSILAAAGRSKVLLWAAVAAMPVVATGVGLSTSVPASLALAIGAVLALGPAAAAGRLGASGGQPDRLPQAGVLQVAPAVAAVAAVHLPLLILVIVGVVPAVGIAADLDAAGWITTWDLTVATGVLSVVVLAVGAARSRSTVMAALVPTTAAVSALLVFAPASTPRLVTLATLPVLATAIELAALVTVRDRFWSRVTRISASVVEVGGALLVPLLILIVLLPPRSAPQPDAEAALSLAVLGVAWGLAAARRSVVGGWRADPVVAAVGMVALQVMAAAVLVAPGTPVTPWLAVGAVVLSLCWIPAGQLRGAAGAVRAGWPAAIALAIGGTALGIGLAWSSPSVLAVGALAVTVLALHVRAAARAAEGDASPALAVLLPTTVGAVVFVSASPGAAGVPASIRAAVAVAVLLGVAALSDPQRLGADLVRATAAIVAMWTPVGGSSVAGLGDGQRLVLDLNVVHPGALAVTVLFVGWLAVDAVRLDRPWLLALAAPVGVRAVLTALVALDVPVEVAGLILLAGAMAATLLAVAEAGRWRLPAATVALVAVPSGWLLIGDDPVLRAWVIVAAGAVLVAAGLLRRLPLVGHLGGATSTLGTWWLLSLGDVTATDLWVLPIATQLWVVGWHARRQGASSWLADVPPMLLVVVPALGERIVGGPGWHTLLAGAIGVVAVAGGGVRRLGGPLIVGSMILAVIAVVETLALVASVPTWTWLALAGCALLATAVAIERSGTSPAASARRLIEVIDERFA